MIRFHLDENVEEAVAGGLRQRGIDVTTAKEVGLVASSDEEQLAFAHAAHRVLVTHDADLLRLHAHQFPHAGVAYCRAGTRTIGEMVRALVLIHDCLTIDEMHGHVEWM